MAGTQQPAAHEGSLVHLSFPGVCVPTHASQYDCVDPTEFQSLKDEIEKLKTEKSAWEAEQATHASNSTEQQEKVIVAAISFAAVAYVGDYLDRCFGENEQGSEGCDYQEQPDLPATNERSGLREYPTEGKPRDCPEGVCCYIGGA